MPNNNMKTNDTKIKGKKSTTNDFDVFLKVFYLIS